MSEAMSATDATPTPEPGAPERGDLILDAANVSKIFGGLVAVDGVSFSVPRKSIVSIIGPNGAGKTTFFNMLTGLYKPSTGWIAFEGSEITNERPDRILKAGMARTFQNIRLFATMTALENVMVGEHSRMQAGLFGSIIRLPSVRKEEKLARDKAAEMLEFVGLRSNQFHQMSVNLAYGDQRRVEIARALASGPKLLLLDEPTANLDPLWQIRLMELVREEIGGGGRAALVAIHDLDAARQYADRILVMDGGRIAAEGLDGPHVAAIFGILRIGGIWQAVRPPEGPRSSP